jgi:hypothetical protein
MFVLQVGVFVALGWVRRDWQIAYVAFVAASLTFLLVHQGALGGGPLLSGFSVSNAQGSVTGLTSHAQQIAAFGARSEALFFWAAAAVAALSYWRKFGQVIVPALFAAMPIGLVAFQNYGGEAIYRVWLFSSPWCAVLIAKRVCDWDKARLVRYLAVVAVCLASFVASAQATIFGMFPMLVMSGSEISGSTWFLDHSPPGTTLVLALSNFPARLNGNYVLHNATNSVNDPILTNSAEFQGSGMERASANQVANFVSTEWGPNSYLVISKSMDTENAYYRTVSPGSLENLEWKLAASPRWAVAYTNGDVTFFRLTGQQ